MLDRNSFHVSVWQCVRCLNSLSLFYRVVVYLKDLMLECPHFSRTTRSIAFYQIWWVYDATVGCC